MMQFTKLIQDYINDHDKAWEATTKKSEAARLNSLSKALDGKNPEVLWKHFEDNEIKSYSRVTAWGRVVSLFDWAISQGRLEGPNAYRAWREKNARLFKHAYERKTPSISFKEAEARITQGIEDPAIKRKALELLYSGLRFSESYHVNSRGVVIGKGGKKRDVFLEKKFKGPDYQGTYARFWKELNMIGLKPHMLRKIRATDLARKGMDLASLCEVMGWSKPETALCYVAPIKKEERRRFFK